MMPCVEMIKWLIQHTIVNIKQIYNELGKLVSSFLLTDVEACCKFPRVDIYLVDSKVKTFVEEHNFHVLFANWYNHRTFRTKGDKLYAPMHFKATFLYAIQLVSSMYDERSTCHIRGA